MENCTGMFYVVMLLCYVHGDIRYVLFFFRFVASHSPCSWFDTMLTLQEVFLKSWAAAIAAWKLQKDEFGTGSSSSALTVSSTPTTEHAPPTPTPVTPTTPAAATGTATSSSSSSIENLMERTTESQLRDVLLSLGVSGTAITDQHLLNAAEHYYAPELQLRSLFPGVIEMLKELKLGTKGAGAGGGGGGGEAGGRDRGREPLKLALVTNSADTRKQKKTIAMFDLDRWFGTSIDWWVGRSDFHEIPV